MMLQTVLSSAEIKITEDWYIVKIIGSKDKLEGINIGDVIEYVPSWSEYKLSDLDRQMYEKGFRYKKILVMKNNQSLDLVNELVPIMMDTATPINEGKMRSDCGDIRFYWWDNTNQAWKEISYWIDNDTVNTNSTKIILRIPSVSANGYVNIVMYYGAKHYGRKDDLTIGYGVRNYEGKYLSFDGVDDYGENANLNISASAITVACKVRVKEYDASKNLWLVGREGNFKIDILTSGKVRFLTNNDWAGSILVSNSSIPQNKWVWLVAVYDGTNKKIYFNGTLDNSLTTSGNITLNGSEFTIGKPQTDGATYFKGDISFVGIWNKALTDAEITDLMSGKVPAGAVVLLDDSGINGNTWVDSSGNGNDVTLYGNPKVYKIGYVMEFDGVDDYIAVQNLVFNRSDYRGITVLAFAKTSSQKYNIVVSWDRSEYFRLALGDDTLGGYEGYVGWDLVVDGVIKDFKSNTKVNDGRVHMIGGVFDGDSGVAKIIIDGQVDSKFTNIGSNLGSGTTRYGYVGIGSESSSFDSTKGPLNYFEGKIYAVFVYNRALNDDEIQQVYENPNDPPRNGLVLWLAPDSVDDINGVWKDKSGLGNNGTIHGATLKEVRTFESTVQTSKVMSFDGVDDYVIFDGFKDMYFDKVTVVAFCDISHEKVSPVVGKADATGAVGSGYEFYLGYGSAAVATIYFYLGFDDGTYSGVQTTTEYPTFSGMVAGVYDGSEAKIYLNGVLDNSAVFGKTIAQYWLPLSIHRYLDTRYGVGSVYKVLVYNRALSDAEIQQLYNDPNNPPLDGLVLWLDGTSIDETNGKWLNKAPALKSGYVEPLDGVIYGATPITLLSSAWSDEIDMNNGVKIVWRGKVVKKVESSNSIVLYVKTDNLMKITGEVV